MAASKAAKSSGPRSARDFPVWMAAGQDLRRHPDAGPLPVAQPGGRLPEAVDLTADRAGRRLAQHRRDLPLEQVVVAATQVASEHQEGDERPALGSRRQADLERLQRPRLRVRPAAEEPSGALGQVPMNGPLGWQPLT